MLFLISSRTTQANFCIIAQSVQYNHTFSSRVAFAHELTSEGSQLVLACNYRGSFAGVTLTWRRAPPAFSTAAETLSSAHSVGGGLQDGNPQQQQQQSGLRAVTEGGEWGAAPSDRWGSAQHQQPMAGENARRPSMTHGSESQQAAAKGLGPNAVLPGTAAVGPLAWPAFYMRQGAHAQVFGDFRSRIQVYYEFTAVVYCTVFCK